MKPGEANGETMVAFVPLPLEEKKGEKNSSEKNFATISIHPDKSFSRVNLFFKSIFQSIYVNSFMIYISRL